MIFVEVEACSAPCSEVSVLSDEELEGAEAETLLTTEDTIERSTGTKVSHGVDRYYKCTLQALTLFMQGVQSWLRDGLLVEVRIMQIAPVMRKANKPPGRWNTMVDALARYWPCICAISYRFREPGAPKQAAYALLLDKLESLMVELITDLPIPN